MTEEVRDCFCSVPVSRTVQIREEGDDAVLLDKAVVITQVIFVQGYLNDKLSRVWGGWNDFNQRLSDTIRSLAGSSDSQVAAVRLTSNELDEFIGTIVPVRWNRRTNRPVTYNVPQSVVTDMQSASAAQQSRTIKLESQVAEMKDEIRSLREKMELVQLFHPVKELLYEYSRPFVARAVEIDGIDDGVSYTVQGLGRDGRWIIIFSHQYHSNEIGLQAFNNDTGYAKYRLICMDDFAIGRARMKLYGTSDGKDEFQRGIPILTSTTHDGYEVDNSSGPNTTWNVVNLFNDKTENPGWISAQNPGTSWIQVKLPRRRIFNAVEIASRGDSGGISYCPKDFSIEGSYDGKRNWVKLCEKRDISWGVGQRQVFTFENDRGFLFYRLFITSSRSDYHSINTINFGNMAQYCGDPVNLAAH